MFTGQHRPPSEKEKEDEKDNTSWNDAANLCSSVGAHLPSFTSREELDDFIHLLRDSSDIPPLEAVFIGLKHNRKKVSYIKILVIYVYNNIRTQT